MKVELYHNKEYTTQEELVNAMISWISYHNNERIKVKLKGKTPVEYRHLALRNMSLNRVSNFVGSLHFLADLFWINLFNFDDLNLHFTARSFNTYRSRPLYVQLNFWAVGDSFEILPANGSASAAPTI